MVSEAQKRSSRRWDKEHMRSLSCRLRTEDAALFKEYCIANNTTPGTLLKEYVNSILKEYRAEREKKAEKRAKTAKAKKA
ncbi:MAG: hypothetical protein ILP19_00490 [Oscillospiraceae bacterium]|nr:hypothetical protein [Oscillospiraceae bacterium]